MTEAAWATQEKMAKLFLLYGPKSVIQAKADNSFILVHLDSPSDELKAQRLAEFDPEKFFDEHCPFCQTVKAGGVVIFDDTTFEDDEEQEVSDGE